MHEFRIISPKPVFLKNPPLEQDLSEVDLPLIAIPASIHSHKEKPFFRMIFYFILNDVNIKEWTLKLI